MQKLFGEEKLPKVSGGRKCHTCSWGGENAKNFRGVFAPGGENSRGEKVPKV